MTKLSTKLKKTTSSLEKKKSKTLGSLAAIQAILDYLPTLSSNSEGEECQTSLSFLLIILYKLGVTENDIIELFCKLLSDKTAAGQATKGLLTAIEETVKAILLANVKNLFTCSMNPFIPNKYMYYYTDSSKTGEKINGQGIEINLDEVDLYNILDMCPTDREGSAFYFDAKTSSYSTDENYVPGYTVNELYKSRDFNAYLWYVINKGTDGGNEEDKLYWDNRNKYFKKFKELPELKDTFFNRNLTDVEHNDCVVTGGGGTAKKKQIVICKYYDRNDNKNGTHILKVYINPGRYFHKRKIKLGKKYKKGVTLWFNKTIFEFNYDYIYSLKLFDTKTLIAAIVNAVLGLTSTLTIGYSVKKGLVSSKVGGIIDKIIQNEGNTEIDDCYFTFSNDDYNVMLEDAVAKHDGTFTYNGSTETANPTEILDSVNSIDDEAVKNKSTYTLSNIFGEISASTASISDTYDKYKFSFGLGIIEKLLEETITQIVMQILTPKVAILFKVNAAIMGDLDPENAPKFDSWEDFLKNFSNVITKTIKEVLKLILEQLYAYVIDNITKLLKQLTVKLALEQIEYYKELIESLISCIQSLISYFQGSTVPITIDNVNYADIKIIGTPSKTC